MPEHQLNVARVYDPRRPSDGTRVLVDRLWPRGLTKAAAALDEWCKDVAPSAALRTWYNHDPQRFAEFARRYRAELAGTRRRGGSRSSARPGPTREPHAAHRQQAARPQRRDRARRTADR